MTRRQKLSAFLGALGMAVLGRSDVAHADQTAVDLLIGQFAGGKKPIEDRMTLDLPAETDDGGAVQITVSVDIPTRENTHLTDLLVVTSGNAQPTIVTFHFSPTSVAEASTRIRLAKPRPSPEKHSVTAVARLSDGTCYKIKRDVTVKEAGCI
ncbi:MULTISPECIES: thiosulfate oxidation carrier protein SoxY [unclassified Bradyrhizobium]|uniref:thiosulfate oxidation carrier protein SoxY n=1 Tax=unclassified Bradyrhizobium TaxID=2631580 RepID=UPI0028E6A5F9|nr:MULTISPECIES: thiosulfate oxidation carrier protein SoxY [unclassified Bradyrhizobium]